MEYVGANVVKPTGEQCSKPLLVDDYRGSCHRCPFPTGWLGK